MSFKVGDAVIRKWNNRVYYVIADIDHGSEFLLGESQDTPFSKCKVCEMPCNLTIATAQEIAAGYRIDHCVEATKKVELFGNSEGLEVLEMIDVSPNCEVIEQ